MAKANSKRQLTPMEKQFAHSCDKKRFDCFVYVAKELTGRAKQRELKANKKSLDWDKFNQYFEKAYQGYSADEILAEILDNVYWLADEQAVIDLYFRYLRNAQENANGHSQEDEDDDDDFAK